MVKGKNIASSVPEVPGASAVVKYVTAPGDIPLRTTSTPLR